MRPGRSREALGTLQGGFWAVVIGLGWALSPMAAEGQEVGGDVMIPAPRELVSSAGITRLGSATARTLTREEMRGAISAVLDQVRRGTMGEREARHALGNVIVSLLVKRGVLVFEKGGG